MYKVSEPDQLVDHQQQLIGLFPGLFDSEEFSDLLLVVNSSLQIHTHRLLLVTQSSIFRTMLCSQHWPEAQQSTVHLTEDDQCLPHFQDFLRYFYTGTINITTASALPVCMLADKYHVTSLKKSCEGFMSENVGTPRMYNRAISWRKYGRLADRPELREACDKFIAWNMDTVISSPDWTSIDADDLHHLLKRSDLVVANEVSLLKAAVDWLTDHPEQTNDVLQNIRFPVMKPSELYQYQFSGIGDKSICSYVERKGTLTYQANSVDIKILSEHNDIPSAPFSVRLYKASDSGCPWQLENYSAQGKAPHQIRFTTKTLLAECKWSITFHPKGERVTTQFQQLNSYSGYCYTEEQIVTDTDNTVLIWRVEKCSLDKSLHDHRLAVLLHTFHNGEWFVSAVKTFSSAGTENRVEDLIPQSERQQYVSNNTMRLHFIGQTEWKEYQPTAL
nr:PREDICTED: BTB/POZ domain-containing protein 17-like [Lepisosteus oculatus]